MALDLKILSHHDTLPADPFYMNLSPAALCLGWIVIYTHPNKGGKSSACPISLSSLRPRRQQRAGSRFNLINIL